MNTTSRPATPDQIRLLIGLSSLMVLPMVAVVMVYYMAHQSASDPTPALRAFAFALVAGAAVGLPLVRFLPLVRGTLPRLRPARAVLPITPIIPLVLGVAFGPCVR